MPTIMDREERTEWSWLLGLAFFENTSDPEEEAEEEDNNEDR